MTNRNLLLLRVCFALLSSGVLALLSQIAIFRYTRSVDAPIPAGEIIGLSASSVSTVLGFLWFALLIFIFLIKNSSKIYVHINNEKRSSDFDLGVISRNLFWWGIVPLVAVFFVSISFVICAPCTAKMLQILGYGGGLEVCHTSDGAATTAHNADLILLTNDSVYIQRTEPGYTRLSINGLSVNCDLQKDLNKKTASITDDA